MVDFAHKLREFVNGESPYPAHVLASFLTFLAMVKGYYADDDETLLRC